jgi:signal transduction histidine kinase
MLPFMKDSIDKIAKEIEAVRQISIVPTMLEVICQTTGMGFAAIARVTEQRWVACSVRDEVGFGLKEGGELEIKTTLCNEIRDHRKPIIIDHVEQDACYKNHHTPKIYGLESYISFPIILKDGSFFGTLCAIDANPAKLNNTKIIGMFTMFAELLSFHLQSIDLLERSYKTTKELQQENTLLTHVNTDLDTFVHTASHDLRSPIANMEGLLTLLSKMVGQEPINREKVTQTIGLLNTSLKRLGITIGDLTSFVNAQHSATDEAREEINMVEVVGEVKESLTHLIEEARANIEISGDHNLILPLSKPTMKSILYNLLSNAIKYRSPQRPVEIVVRTEKVNGKIHLLVSDNGLGIPSDKQEQVFTMFKRFHDHVEGSGLGLYIVRRMIEAAKGHIEVRSKEEEGTTFAIVF